MAEQNQKETAKNLSSANGDLSTAYHIPVLLHETIDYLNIKPGGTYVDCTFGGGGHSREMLKQLNETGRLIAFDQDADAAQNLPVRQAGLSAGQEGMPEERILFIPQNFRHLKRFLRLNGISQVDGILADLGVSSHQFDEAERGFSTRFNAALDMRMDRRQEITAADIVQTRSEAQLHKLFEQYGEVTNAKTLAKKIAEVRNLVSLKTVDGFKQALRDVVKGNPNKYFAQVFQALRIEVNEEMVVLKEMLEQSAGLLKTGGRIAVITFHSIEDRLVKNFFRKGTFEEKEEHPFMNEEKESVFKVITKKPVTAGDDELKRNPRARSAKLRVAERM